MEPISDKTETGKTELSVEEIKKLRLCKCGNWKHAKDSICWACSCCLGLQDGNEYSEDEHKKWIDGRNLAKETGIYQYLTHGLSETVEQQRLLSLKYAGVRLEREDFLKMKGLGFKKIIKPHIRKIKKLLGYKHILVKTTPKVEGGYCGADRTRVLKHR